MARRAVDAVDVCAAADKLQQIRAHTATNFENSLPWPAIESDDRPHEVVAGVPLSFDLFDKLSSTRSQRSLSGAAGALFPELANSSRQRARHIKAC
jgi:hypothetical protein